jgi:uncharacterized protein YecE (DUF72 family)
MARLLVGLPALAGDVEKYASKFDLVELRAGDAALPKPATLRRWRKAVPPHFAFSVVLPPAVGELAPGKALDAGVATSIEVAATLEARCVVLQTPADVRPTTANKKRIAAVMERIPREGTVRCWEPAGIWEREDVLAFARSMGVIPVFDVARDAPGAGPIVYTRLRALGKSAILGSATVARVGERLKKRREVFVVVEGAGEAPARPGAGTVVRPTSSTLVAEDEEQ